MLIGVMEESDGGRGRSRREEVFKYSDFVEVVYKVATDITFHIRVKKTKKSKEDCLDRRLKSNTRYKPRTPRKSSVSQR
jgi:hypothetical protein